MFSSPGIFLLLDVIFFLDIISSPGNLIFLDKIFSWIKYSPG